MQDFARLRVGKWIEGFCLSVGENPKNAFGDGRVKP